MDRTPQYVWIGGRGTGQNAERGKDPICIDPAATHLPLVGVLSSASQSRSLKATPNGSHQIRHRLSVPRSHYSPSSSRRTSVSEFTFDPVEGQVLITPDKGSSVFATIEEEALNVHNSFRASHGASPLSWDNTLADYANNQASRCVFEHSGGPYGGASAYGPSLLVEDTQYILQRTWLLELVLLPLPTGSTRGWMRPRIMTPKTLNPHTSPRSFGRAPQMLDAPLLLALLAPSSQKFTECVSFRPLLSIVLTHECRVECWTPLVQL